jgi:hypothetical protein
MPDQLLGRRLFESPKPPYRLIQGDCLAALKTFEPNSIDALVTDPPAGISFMQKKWDQDRGGRDQWIAWLETIARECLRVMKPGAHGLVWALPRTSHWTATALENAGFEIRDRISHLFGSGFPKSVDTQYTSMIESGVCLSNEPVPHVVAVSKFIRLSCDEVKERIAVALARIPQEEGLGLLIRIGAAGGSSAVMAMSPVLWLGEDTSLNTASSWNKRSVAFWDRTRTCITETEFAETIGEKTWSFVRDQITRKTIIPQKETRPNGCRCPASVVVQSLSVSVGGCERIPTCFVPGSAGDDPDFNAGLVIDPRTIGSVPKVEHSVRAHVCGCGTGNNLKPACEDWWLIHNPLDGTVAQNVLKHGTGGINIASCRIGRGENDRYEYGVDGDEPSPPTKNDYGVFQRVGYTPHELGRYPANVILGCSCDSDAHESDCAVRRLDEQTIGKIHGAGGACLGKNQKTGQNQSMFAGDHLGNGMRYGDAGGASRFYYCAKSSRRERGKFNDHPTVKPLALMQYLCRLITPPKGKILDPFAGSGSTGVAALQEGFEFIGIEQDPHYVEIAERRCREA